LPTIKVNFKSSEGIFNYYDHDQGVAVDAKTMDGIIIGTGFKYSSLIGRPTKTKSIAIDSSVFGWDTYKNGKVKIYKRTRVKGQDPASDLVGEKTVEQWKEDGYKVCKVVYFLDPTDKETIYQLVASGRTFFNLSKLIKADAPNFIMTFKPSTDTVSTDNGDFYDIELEKKSNINPDDADVILEKVTLINNYVNKIKPITLSDAQDMFDDTASQKPARSKTDDEPSIEDIPF